MRNKTRAIPTSPAEKAAALSREATGRPHPDDDGLELAEDKTRSKRSKVVRRTLGLLLVLAVLAGGGYAAWAWSQKQYYVAADAGRVAIFQGVSQDLGPIRLSHVQSQSDVLVSDLPTDVQGSVGNTITARDLADAELKVAALRTEAQRCQQIAAGGTPCGTSPAPTPTTPLPTTPATPTPSTPVPSTPAPSVTTPPPAVAAAFAGVVA
jgi:protein phosphatase